VNEETEAALDDPTAEVWPTPRPTASIQHRILFQMYIMSPVACCGSSQVISLSCFGGLCQVGLFVCLMVEAAKRLNYLDDLER
jgi:hypothetical protein